MAVCLEQLTSGLEYENNKHLRVMRFSNGDRSGYKPLKAKKRLEGKGEYDDAGDDDSCDDTDSDDSIENHTGTGQHESSCRSWVILVGQLRG